MKKIASMKGYSSWPWIPIMHDGEGQRDRVERKWKLKCPFCFWFKILVAEHSLFLVFLNCIMFKGNHRKTYKIITITKSCFIKLFSVKKLRGLHPPAELNWTMNNVLETFGFSAFHIVKNLCMAHYGWYPSFGLRCGKFGLCICFISTGISRHPGLVLLEYICPNISYVKFAGILSQYWLAKWKLFSWGCDTGQSLWCSMVLAPEATASAEPMHPGSYLQ